MMRTSFIFTGLFMLFCGTEAAIAQAVPVAPGSSVGTSGQSDRRVRLMVMREVDSSLAKPGDIVKFSVDETVWFEGKAIAVGTPAFGVVQIARNSGAALKRGELEVRLTHMIVDGINLPLRGDLFDRGEGGKGDDAAKAFLAPLYLLFARGNLAKLRAGEIVYGELVPNPAA